MKPWYTTFQITATHFCCGIVLNRCDTAVRAAPIVHYMLGWTKDRIEEYCFRKGWKIALINPLDSNSNM